MSFKSEQNAKPSSLVKTQETKNDSKEHDLAVVRGQVPHNPPSRVTQSYSSCCPHSHQLSQAPTEEHTPSLEAYLQLDLPFLSKQSSQCQSSHFLGPSVITSRLKFQVSSTTLPSAKGKMSSEMSHTFEEKNVLRNVPHIC